MPQTVGEKLEQVTEPTRSPTFPFLGKIHDILTGSGGNQDGVKKANEEFQAAQQKINNQQAQQNLPSQPKAAPAKVTPKTTLPSHEDGIDDVPNTGPAILHKHEAVLNKEDAENYRAGKRMANKKYNVEDELGGKKKKGPKEIKHIISRKGKDHEGNHVVIHTHVHTHPEHADEEHISDGDDQLADHMMEHLGTPNEGEAEAEAGQSGIPEAEPQPGASAAGGM